MKTILTYFVLIFSILIVGCNENTKPKAQYIDNDRPGDTATVYFDALYNQHNLHKASNFATPTLSRIMKSYGTANQFSRSLINLQYDEVVIEIDMSNSSLREQYGNQAKISIVFTGYFNGEKIDDFRTVEMQKIKGKWYVDKIVADPYGR
ncbi:hypothetical protein [Pseudoalteromonas sp.]|uniref:hypothetical protein n=1 Tax=Pseudoalteromonas sp. TaxID=53249 RepID=UPI003568703A